MSLETRPHIVSDDQEKPSQCQRGIGADMERQTPRDIEPRTLDRTQGLTTVMLVERSSAHAGSGNFFFWQQGDEKPVRSSHKNERADSLNQIVTDVFNHLILIEYRVNANKDSANALTEAHAKRESH